MNVRSKSLFTILLLVLISAAVLISARPAFAETQTSVLNQASCISGICSIQGNQDLNPHLSAGYSATAKLDNNPSYITNNASIQYLDVSGDELVKLTRENPFLFGMTIWLFGFLLAFTPCVLPLIVLITGFLGQGNEISYSRSVLLALTYVMSLSLTFAVIGILAASFGIYVSSYFQSPWILASFSILLALLALSLLGFYNLRLPARIQHMLVRHNKLQSNYQFLEVILMGVIATLITSPCIAGPLLSVLAYIGETKNVALGAVSLFAFGVGVGTPLILATIINKGVLPNTNSTLQAIVKFLFGLVIFGIAIWISSRILPAGVNMLLWSLLVVFTAIYMQTIIKRQEINSYFILWKSITLLMLTFGVMIFVGYLMGNKVPTNPLNINQVMYVKPNKFTEISSLYSMNRAIENAKSLKKPIIVLFSADWCSECQELKAQMMNDRAVQEELDKYIMLEVNVSSPGSSEQSLAKQFSVAGTPEILFFDASGHLSNKRIAGRISPEELDSILSVMNK